MKKSVIIFIVSALVIISTIIWIFATPGIKAADLFEYVVIFLLVAFALFIGIKKLGNVKRGEPSEDELSKKIMKQTAATSYYISLYIWLLIMYLSDKVELECHELMGAGILAMAVTFGISWLIINFRGIRND